MTARPADQKEKQIKNQIKKQIKNQIKIYDQIKIDILIWFHTKLKIFLIWFWPT